MYWPLLLAAWYSSAGMDSSLSVFIGNSSWVSDGHTSWRLSINSSFFSKWQGRSAKKGDFPGKKNRPGGALAGCAGMLPSFQKN
jgi:hypothetical protein